MKNEIFKVLRCKCGKQSYEPDPVAPAPICPRCGQSMKYSADWYIKVMVDGKRHIQKVGRQRRQVEQVLSRALADITHEKYLKRHDDAPLLSLAIEDTYRDKWKRNKDGDRQKVRSELILEMLGDVYLDEIGLNGYQTLLRCLEDRGVEDSTINRYLACLRSMLRRHKIDYSWLEMLDEREGRIYVLTVQEEAEILRVLRDKTLRHWPKRQAYLDEFADMAVVLLDTGMRVGELLRLTARDVNKRTNLITIWETKADKPRSVPMTDRCRKILEARLDRTVLFACNQNQVGQAWDLVRVWTGITDRDYVPHAFRHTCATRLLEAGVDIYTVKEWLGHKTIQTTLRYLHMMPGRLADAAAALQNHVNNQSTDVVTDGNI